MISRIRSSTSRFAVAAAAGGIVLAAAGCELLVSDALRLEVGDCLADEDLAPLVERVETVPCDEPHNYEVYASIELPDGEFPGTAAIETEAQACEEEFEIFVGVPYVESELHALPLTPTEESWELDDREILCLIHEEDTETAGTLEGAGR